MTREYLKSTLHYKWGACITLFGKNKYLGIFEKFEDAVQKRKEVEEQYYECV